MRSILIRCSAAVALVFVLLAVRLKDHYVPLPNPLAFDLTLEPGEEGRADPLIVSGRTHAGDFLTVRFENERTIQFLYDSWGIPAIRSQPVTLQPGERLRLVVEMPALDRVLGNFSATSDRVRVTCNGVMVLDEKVHFFAREPNRIFFGENTLGGTACGTTLRGQMVTADGQVLRGGSQPHPSRRERFLHWFHTYPGQVAGLVAMGFALAFYSDRVGRRLPRPGTCGRVALRHRWFIGAAAVATVIYTWLVTLGSFQFNYAEIFGSFYDYQASSILQGHLDVPEEAIGGEAFEARGRLYGYFGPTPAVLRMPFTVLGFAFGKLSRVFMLAYFVACLTAAYLLLQHAFRSLGGPAASARAGVPTRFATLVMVASVGLGSTVFFLGSRGLIFHEAILGGITFALWSAWCALRHLDAPEGRWWVGAWVCGLASIHTRPPTGLFALTLLGCVTVVATYREWQLHRWARPRAVRRYVGIAALCFAGLLSLNGLAWLKFRIFDAAPLRISRPYTQTPGRLEHIDSKSFHLVNLGFNFDTYVLFPNFHLERGFPWIYLGTPKPRRDFPHAKMDLPDHTLAMPYAMTSLFGLATLGCLGAVLAFPGTRVAVGTLWAAVLPMSLALFAAIATAQRYTGDFCPFLIAAGAYGLAALENSRSRWRLLWRSLTLLATAFAVAVTVAITLHYQGVTLWGMPDETQANYRHLRERVDAWFSR